MKAGQRTEDEEEEVGGRGQWKWSTRNDGWLVPITCAVFFLHGSTLVPSAVGTKIAAERRGEIYESDIL